jgi:hypothetical protein
MTLRSGCSTATEAERPRRIGYWLVVTAALALQWAASGALAAAPAANVACSISNELSQPTASAVVELNEAATPASDLARLSNDRPSDDDPLAAPLLAQPPDYGARLRARATYADPRTAFPRGFDPRAPPLAV